MVDSHLVIKDFYGATLYRIDLIASRDHFSEIRFEFTGLEITGGGIVLHVNRHHYKGLDRFNLPFLPRR